MKLTDKRVVSSLGYINIFVFLKKNVLRCSKKKKNTCIAANTSKCLIVFWQTMTASFSMSPHSQISLSSKLWLSRVNCIKICLHIHEWKQSKHITVDLRLIYTSDFRARFRSKLVPLQNNIIFIFRKMG